ncbi:GTPase HflX [Ectothiorhodospiraceae bacterium 2226]|nr:GTPase HflX [Ectothiorhodospiraceae bacterium 2226]
MLDRPRSGERAVLVHPSGSAADEELLEFQELITAAGAEPVAVITSARKFPDPAFYVGSGKVDEIEAAVAAHAAEVVVVNHALSPAQERNLERRLRCRVLDRTGLILDIFAQRARSHEGKLQVELAQLQHMASRLVRGWTHLERQKGGIGLRGPGETQLETDRRLLNLRIKALQRELAKVSSRREQGRRSRRRAGLPVVSLVGYTNAGKSTLFNRLTGAGVYAADQLFATLDPTLRRLELPGGATVVLADTVGFIRHLPHDLVAAFRSTLQETREADLLLHVVDASDDNRAAYTEQVNRVLAEIGADEVPQILVYNKVDRLEIAPHAERGPDGRLGRVWVSAVTGAGLDVLEQALREHFGRGEVHYMLRLPPAESSRLRARLYELGAVLGETTDPDGASVLEVRLGAAEYEALCRDEALDRWVQEPGPGLAALAVATQGP